MVRFGLLLAALFVMTPMVASAQVGGTAYNVTFFSSDGQFEGVIQFFEDTDDDPADDMDEAGDVDISVGPDAPDVVGSYEAMTPRRGETTEFTIKGTDEDGARVSLSGTVEPSRFGKSRKISGNGRTGNGVFFFFTGKEIRPPRR